MRGVVRKAKGSRKNKGVSGRYDCCCSYDDWCGGTINHIAVSLFYFIGILIFGSVLRSVTCSGEQG
jgi:hypothetical protein